MEPNSFGKKLGIGMRVAGKIARDRAQEAAARQAARTPGAPCDASPASASSVGQQTASAAAQQTATAAAAHAQRTARAFSQGTAQAAQKGRNLGHGIGRGSRQFGRSFFRPLAHASNVLWLEVTGCFFALFAAFFGQNIYRVRAQYASGPKHHTFLLYCALTALFVYFSASSFLRARRRARKAAGGN